MQSSIVRVLIVVVVIVAATGALVYLERSPISRVASILGITVTVSDISQTPTPDPAVVPPLADRVPALSLGTVAVQTMQGTYVVRTAAGTAVTSDGLIITTAVGAPYGTGIYTYRVVTSRGETAPARRVAYDAEHALVLLQAELIDPGTVPFSEVAPRAGDTLTAVGAGVVRSQYVPVILTADVVSIAAELEVVVSLDRTFVSALAGARLVDRSGATIGILRSDSVAGSIPASAVNAFISRYLGTLGNK